MEFLFVNAISKYLVKQCVFSLLSESGWFVHDLGEDIKGYIHFACPVYLSIIKTRVYSSH